jgi:hypothetical protein
MLGKFILKAVIGPFVSTVAAKAGEAVGDLLAFHLNPPAEVKVCEQHGAFVGETCPLHEEAAEPGDESTD